MHRRNGACDFPEWLSAIAVVTGVAVDSDVVVVVDVVVARNDFFNDCGNDGLSEATWCFKNEEN